MYHKSRTPLVQQHLAKAEASSPLSLRQRRIRIRGCVVGDRILGLATDSQADWCAGYGKWGAYRFVGASAIGKLHLRENLPRDDAFCVRTAGVWLAVAVADGAGSYRHSRYGACFAVESLCEHLLRAALGISPPEPKTTGELPQEEGDEKAPQLPSLSAGDSGSMGLSAHSSEAFHGSSGQEEQGTIPLPVFDVPVLIPPSEEIGTDCGTLAWHLKHLAQTQKDQSFAEAVSSNGTLPTTQHDMGEYVRCAFQRTRQGLEQFARSRGVSLQELHCTLLGMLLNTETGAVAVGHIGDGLVAGFHRERGAQPLIEAPTPGTVGETYVLTQNDWEKYLVVRRLTSQEAEGMITFYLMSDGVADDCTHPPPEDIFQKWARDIDRELRKEEPTPQTATRLLRWLATYEVKGSWDDRTLVVIMRDLNESAC